MLKPVVEFEECLRDSPRFREVLETNEADIDLLEQKLEKLIKLCSNMVDTGKGYLYAKSLFINGIWDLSAYFKDDEFMVATLNKFIQALTEMLKYQSILIDQAQRAICKNLNNFIKSDIKNVKDTRKYFEKISDDFDNTLIRNSQMPKNKPIECEDVGNTLMAVRSCYQHTGLDYISQISGLQSRKRYEITDTLLSLMHAHSTYFHQGYDLFQDVDPYFKQLSVKLADMRSSATSLEKQMESRHQLVNDFKESSILSVPNWRKCQGIVQEGYLFKRTSNAFKTWNRRWFMIQQGQLVYRKRCKDDNLTIMEEDLKLCSVKPCHELDRRHCFEVMSPSKSHMLQADSLEQCQHWINSIQSGINRAIQSNSLYNDEEYKPHSSQINQDVNFDSNSTNSGSSSGSNDASSSTISICNGPAPPKPLRVVSTILSVEGNEKCCDCGSEQPQWASINLGITLCIECSGIHRSLGVHFSKVRSLTLDAWEPELLKLMLELGNDVVNKLYEAYADDGIVRVTPESSREERENWIKAKYVEKKFVGQFLSNINDNNNKINKNKIVRKWSVRKVNRRRRTLLECNAKDPASEGACNEDNISLSNNSVEDSKSVEMHAGTVEEDQSTHDSSSLWVIGDSFIDELMIDPDILLDDSDDNEQQDAGGKNVTETMALIDDIDKLSPDLLLYRAASVHNVRVMCQALAQGANPNWINTDDNDRRPLHQAILSGSIMATEYLMLNGTKCNIQDKKGLTPLHLSTELGNTGQVCLLLKRGIDQRTKDVDGRDALAIAVKEANADIVTLLRLGRLNEEMRELDFGNTSDETFNDVVRDFSQMASNNPEKLRRPPSAS